MNEDIASCIAGFLGEEIWDSAAATRSSSARTSGAAAVNIGGVTSGSPPPPLLPFRRYMALPSLKTVRFNCVT